MLFMTNKNKQIEMAAREEFSMISASLADSNFDSNRRQSYVEMGIEYWKWFDTIAKLEARFGRDISANVDNKFKVETVDMAIDALFNAPAITSIYKK